MFSPNSKYTDLREVRSQLPTGDDSHSSQVGTANIAQLYVFTVVKLFGVLALIRKGRKHHIVEGLLVSLILDEVTSPWSVLENEADAAGNLKVCELLVNQALGKFLSFNEY